MTVETTEKSERTLYLFSSCLREIYKRQNYEALAYPPGFILRFRYEKEWVHRSVSSVDEIEQRTGIIVVTVGEPGSYRFFPVRRVTIHDAEWRGRVLVLDLELEAELVDYTNNTNPSEKIQSLSARPYDTEPDVDQDVFLSASTDPDITFVDTNGEDRQRVWWNSETAWEAIVSDLGETNEFQNQLFYRLVGLVSSNQQLAPVSELHDAAFRGYQISSRENYRLEYSLLFVNGAPEQVGGKLQIQSDKNIKILPNTFDLGFRSEEKVAYLLPHRNRKNADIPVVTQIADTEELETPDLNIPFYIKSDTKRRAASILLIFIGIGLASGIINPLLPLISDNLPEGLSIPSNTISTILALVGVTLTAFAFDFYREYS